MKVRESSGERDIEDEKHLLMIGRRNESKRV